MKHSVLSQLLLLSCGFVCGRSMEDGVVKGEERERSEQVCMSARQINKSKKLKIGRAHV